MEESEIKSKEYLKGGGLLVLCLFIYHDIHSFIYPRTEAEALIKQFEHLESRIERLESNQLGQGPIQIKCSQMGTEPFQK